MNANYHTRQDAADIIVTNHYEVDENNDKYIVTTISTSDGDMSIFMSHEQYRQLVKQLKKGLKNL